MNKEVNLLIDMELLKKSTLSTPAFIVLSILYNFPEEDVKNKKKLLQGFEEVYFVELSKKHYLVKYSMNFNKFSFVPNNHKINTLFSFDEGKINFDEIFDIYPAKVRNKFNGERPLRPAGKDAVKYSVLKNKYLKKVKTVTEHNLIVKALQYQLMSLKKSNSLMFLQGMEVWVNQSTWELWVDRVKNWEASNEQNYHGQNL